jgi:hypothetical protein
MRRGVSRAIGAPPARASDVIGLPWSTGSVIRVP